MGHLTLKSKPCKTYIKISLLRAQDRDLADLTRYCRLYHLKPKTFMPALPNAVPNKVKINWCFEHGAAHLRIEVQKSDFQNACPENLSAKRVTFCMVAHLPPKTTSCTQGYSHSNIPRWAGQKPLYRGCGVFYQYFSSQSCS